MTDDIRTCLKTRQAEVTASIAREKKNAETAQRQLTLSRESIADLKVRLDEITCLMQKLGVAGEDQNVIHMHQKQPGSGSDSGGRTRPELRYRQPGPTTDIVALAYGCVGIEIEGLVGKAQTLHKANGVSSETIRKLIRRMIKEGYAYCEGTKFYLTPLCKKAWESSPLFRKVAVNA
ncbi:MAG: hypothetical protein ACRDHW_10590 [Ktedonobacteraceae bacterium]